MELIVNLPDSLANEAKAAGLLTADAIEQLLREAVQRKAVGELFEAMDRMADANPLSVKCRTDRCISVMTTHAPLRSLEFQQAANAVFVRRA